MKKTENHSGKENEEKKKPKWRIRRELEQKLRILKVDRRVLRKIVITVFRIAVTKKQEGVEEPIIKVKTVCKEGGHKGNTTYGFFESTMNSDSPILMKLEKTTQFGDDYTQGHITIQAKNILKEDIRIYNELDKHGFVNDFDLGEIQELDKLLDEFYGL